MSDLEIQISILGPALLAGLIVLSTHVPLGQQVLARGIVFIDLAIAQIAGLGVTLAGSFLAEPHGWQVQVAAVSAALAGSFLLTMTERFWPEVQEALIGVLFVLAACVELLLLANNPHGGEHLKDMLVGQILWVSPSTLPAVALLYAGALALFFWRRGDLGHLGFYVLFAVVVTQSVQLVGIYLVFASLIVPALAAKRFSPRWRLLAGYAVGIIGYVAGIVASSLLDLPTGPMIVAALCLTFALSVLVVKAAPVNG